MQSLSRLLRPASIAVIGGGVWCENVIRQCRQFGFEGALWSVHPRKTRFAGCQTYPSVKDLPAPPDAAFIGVNASASIKVLRDLADLGAGGAICFASGFSEAAEEIEGAADRQAALVEAAGDMPVLGPNCYGCINALDRVSLWPDQHGLAPATSGVAIISQSSNIALNLTMQTRGLPTSYLVTIGNQAQTGLPQMAEALAEDPRVTAIGLHIEGIDDLAAFERFARHAHALGKPVTALKIGRSDAARRAALSHTASLSGSAAGASALLSRLGIAEVSSLCVLLETLKIQHCAGRLPASSIASMSCSGGEASLIADTAHGTRIRFPGLAAPQRRALRDSLGPKVALANPLDYHTYIWGDETAMARTFTAMMDGPAALGVVVLDLPRTDRCAADDWMPTLAAARRARTASGKPFAVLSALPEGLPEPIARALLEDGIIPLCGLECGLKAIAAAASPPLCPQTAPIYVPGPVKTPAEIPEAEAKTRLARHGLHVPNHQSAANTQSAIKAAEVIGFPVVLKGAGIAHKSDAGAVALGLQNADAVASAAAAMTADAFLVEEMIPGPHVELLIGIIRDPAHGMVLTLAAGGILTEILQGATSRLLPLERRDVHAALRDLRIWPMLSGYRGARPCDLEAIVDAVMALQSYAMTHPVCELEINPLLCGPDYAIAADALILCGDEND